jgi:ribosomal protein L7Ae-like RNA K-turn-binding protein
MKTEEIRGLLGLAKKAGSLVIGSRETRAGLHRGQVRLMLLAADGSPRDRERLERLAEEAGTPVRVAGPREELGRAVGRDSVSVVGVTDRNLAAGLLGRLDGTASPRGRAKNGGQRP